MTPVEYLKEYFNCVNNALGETLRQDYGPDVSDKYYGECVERLAAIETNISSVKPSNLLSISAYISQLHDLSNWICLIERSQLGAFSWPFAFSLRRMAIAVLSEKDYKGDLQKPIVHVVADGTGYLINYEPRVPAASAKQKFVVISFPRALKHHVLLHTIFGHELGHAALFTTGSGPILIRDVINPLMAKGPCEDIQTLTDWLHDANAPPEIKTQLAAYKASSGADFKFNNRTHQSWVIEIFCDIFGLILFGPSFLAAHRAILQPSDSNPYECNLNNATHPPYAVRHRVLVEIFKILGWDKPTVVSTETDIHAAEVRFLNYLTNDNSPAWANIVENVTLSAIAGNFVAFFAKHSGIAYSPANSQDIACLVKRLISRLPPVQEELGHEGEPSYKPTHISHCMYAGWVYWIAKDNLSADPLSFTLTNRLCDQALLQQEAVNRAFFPGLVA